MQSYGCVGLLQPFAAEFKCLVQYAANWNRNRGCITAALIGHWQYVTSAF